MMTSHRLTFLICRASDAPKIFYPSGTKTVLWWEGHKTKLNCSAVGNPPAQFSWTSGNWGSKRSLDVRRGGNTSVLTITSSLDLTNYTCTAHNDVGDESRFFIVKPIREYLIDIFYHHHNGFLRPWMQLVRYQESLSTTFIVILFIMISLVYSPQY